MYSMPRLTPKNPVCPPDYNDYQTITLQTEDEPKQIDLEIDKNLDTPIVIDDDLCAQYH